MMGAWIIVGVYVALIVHARVSDYLFEKDIDDMWAERGKYAKKENEHGNYVHH